jgi:hypothetical protein
MRILIAGLAKTGTTALFYLVRSSLGGKVTALFEPDKYQPAPSLPGDAVTLAKIIIKPEVDSKSSRDSTGRSSIALESALFDAYVTETRDALLYEHEDLVEGRYQGLERFLGFPISGKADVPKFAEQRVVRTKGLSDWRNWMTESDAEFFRPLLDPVLEKYGYDSHDWNMNRDPVIAPAHCSEYFLRLVSEARSTSMPFRGFA